MRHTYYIHKVGRDNETQVQHIRDGWGITYLGLCIQFFFVQQLRAGVVSGRGWGWTSHLYVFIVMILLYFTLYFVFIWRPGNEMLHLNGLSFHHIQIQTPAGCVNHSSLSATAWAIFTGLTNQRPYRCYCTQLTSATLPNNGTSIIAGPHLCWRSSSDRLALFFNWTAMFSSVQFVTLEQLCLLFSCQKLWVVQILLYHTSPLFITPLWGTLHTDQILKGKVITADHWLASLDSQLSHPLQWSRISLPVFSSVFSLAACSLSQVKHLSLF